MNKLLIFLLIFLSHSIQAELVSADSNGFEVKIEKLVPVSQPTAYQQFINVGSWWNADHTWFGKSEDLYIEAKAGGCFCEVSGDKQALHMLVSYVNPNKELRMIGGLGPLQAMGVHGGMVWKFEKVDNKTTKIVFNYKVVGRMEGGLDTLAPVVEKVLNLQLSGLANKLSGK